MHARHSSLSSFLVLTLVLLGGCDGGGGAEPPATPAKDPAPPAATKPASVATPGTVSATPARFDLGAIEPGSEHPRTFEITNSTDKAVRFIRAVPSCKCTTVTKIENKSLAAGESMSFEAILVAPRTPGIKEAKIQLALADGPPIQLSMVGDVTMPIKATPAFIGGPKGKTTSGTIEIKSLDDQPFTILSAGGEPPRLDGSNGAAPASAYTLSWDVTRIADLSRHVWWVVFTDHPACPVLPIRIRNPETGSRADMARYDRCWTFDERIVNAERMKAGEGGEYEVVLAHYNPRQRGAVVKPTWRNVRGIRSLSPDATAEMVAVTPISREEIRVRFRFTPAADFSGPLEALVLFETDTGAGECTVLALVD